MRFVGVDGTVVEGLRSCVCVCVFAMTSPGVSAAEVGEVALSGSSD